MCVFQILKDSSDVDGCWNSSVSIGTSWSAVDFSIHDGKSSGPVALCGFRFFNNL